MVPGAAVTEWLACSSPTKPNRVQTPAGGNRAGRCRWTADFLGDLPFPPPLHFRSCFTLISFHPHQLSRARCTEPPKSLSSQQQLSNKACRSCNREGAGSRPVFVEAALSPEHRQGAVIQGRRREKLHEEKNKEQNRELGVYSLLRWVGTCKIGATGSERLTCSHPTKTSRIQSHAWSLPDFRMWESCRTIPLVGAFSRGSPVFPTLSFRRCSILTSITLIDSQDLGVKRHPNLFTNSPAKFALLFGAIKLNTHPAANGKTTPPRVCTVFSIVGIVADVAAGRRVFSVISRFQCPRHSGAASYSPHVTLIGSEDLDVNSHPNLFTHCFPPFCWLVTTFRCLVRLEFSVQAECRVQLRKSVTRGSCHIRPRRLLMGSYIATANNVKVNALCSLVPVVQVSARAIQVQIQRENMYLTQSGATVAEWPACSPPITAIRAQSPAGSLRILACGNSAGRCRLLAGLLGDLPLPPPTPTPAPPPLSHFNHPHRLSAPARLPPMRTGLNPRPGHRVFACGNSAGGFLGYLSFPPPFRSGAAPYSPESPSSALKTSTLRAAQISSLFSRHVPDCKYTQVTKISDSEPDRRGGSVTLGQTGETD
ncbi:hypothetical protein PR048_012346 [Dryococelus australis]|uniref:Uncharacterized protein n=1 Tax=Dryococelus australis TaxID=614101 RepID=A0ABQ9HP85_9NEOP|nr:hypothetical protein PR048_012346 [Dryococelus australis]